MVVRTAEIQITWWIFILEMREELGTWSGSQPNWLNNIDLLNLLLFVIYCYFYLKLIDAITFWRNFCKVYSRLLRKSLKIFYIVWKLWYIYLYKETWKILPFLPSTYISFIFKSLFKITSMGLLLLLLPPQHLILKTNQLITLPLLHFTHMFL